MSAAARAGDRFLEPFLLLMIKPEASQFQVAATATRGRRYIAAFARYRPRVLTLLLAAPIAALLLFVNLTGEYGTRRVPAGSLPTGEVGRIAVGNASNTDLNLTIDFDIREPDATGRTADNSLQCMSYGWPLLWRQYLMVGGYGLYVVGETYSGVRLAINAAIWLVLLVGPAACCEWLLRRFRPRLRFSLRTLLAATALGAALCGWFAAARNRANIQDPLIAAMGSQRGRVWVERWGPKWLDLVGADRYRRRIVGIELYANDGDDENEPANQGERLLADLKRLPDLRFLYFEAASLTPETAGALRDLRQLGTLWLYVDEAPATVRTLAASVGGMRHLRVLNLDFGIFSQVPADAAASHELLAAIGAMPQLEFLSLAECYIAREDFALLAKLTNLKSLALSNISAASDEFPPDPPLLVRLPALPRLETLDLEHSEIYDADLPYVAALPRLKTLDLSYNIGITDAGLAELARLESLETLVIDEHLHAPEALRNAKPELAIQDDGQWEEGPWDLEQMAPKCETIPETGGGSVAERAVRLWQEQQAASSQPAGTANPAAPQNNAGR